MRRDSSLGYVLIIKRVMVLNEKVAFRSDIRKKSSTMRMNKALEHIAWRSCECPITGGVEGWMGP